MSHARSLLLMIGVGLLAPVCHVIGCANASSGDDTGLPPVSVVPGADAAPNDAALGAVDAASPCSPSGFCPVPFRFDISWSSISGTASDDVWIAGSAGVIEHWDGTDWKESKLVREDSPLDDYDGYVNPETLYSVTARSRHEVWAVGSCLAPFLSNGWDPDGGATWHATGNAFGQPNVCYSLASSPDSGIWVSGFFGTVRHSDGWKPDGGAAWTDVGGTDNFHYGVTILATWLSPNQDLWLAGRAGLIGRLPHTDAGLPAFYPDDAKTPPSLNFNANTIADLSALWGSDAQHVWAAGGAGTIVHLDVGVDGVPRFVVDESPTSQTLTAMWGSSASNIWAVGVGGTIIHFDGTHWSEEASRPEWGALRAIWGSGPDDIWAIGDSSILLHKTIARDGGAR